MLQVGARRDAQHGFAKAEDAMRGKLERLRDPIVGRAGDHNLQRVMTEECGGESVGGGEKTVLRRDGCEGFESFLRGEAVTVVSGESVKANQRDGPDGISAGRGRILKRLAANVEAAHGRGVAGAIEKSAAV